MSVHWWTREGLDYREGELHLGRQNLADLVHSSLGQLRRRHRLRRAHHEHGRAGYRLHDASANCRTRHPGAKPWLIGR